MAVAAGIATGFVGRFAMGASQAQYLCRRLRTPLKSKSNKVSNVIKEAFILRSLRSLSKVHWTFFTYHGPSLSPRLNPKSGDFSGLGSQVHWTCSYATPLQSAEGRVVCLPSLMRQHRLNQSNEAKNSRPRKILSPKQLQILYSSLRAPRRHSCRRHPHSPHSPHSAH